MKLIDKRKLTKSLKDKYFKDIKNAVTIIIEERIKHDRRLSCQELFENGYCKCLKKVKNRRRENIYRCNGKNKQPIHSPYYVRPGWCFLLEKRKYESR